jgi:Ribonuclease G/E
LVSAAPKSQTVVVVVEETVLEEVVIVRGTNKQTGKLTN